MKIIFTKKQQNHWIALSWQKKNIPEHEKGNANEFYTPT